MSINCRCGLRDSSSSFVLIRLGRKRLWRSLSRQMPDGLIRDDGPSGELAILNTNGFFAANEVQ